MKILDIPLNKLKVITKHNKYKNTFQNTITFVVGENFKNVFLTILIILY